MTMDESVKILAILAAAYPNFYKNMTEDEASGAAVVWTIQFADIPADIVFMAVNKAIGCCKYPPSICEVKEKLRTLHWDAYSMLDDRVNAISETARAEYQRIYEATKQFKIMKTEPDLNELLITNSQRYLLG